MTKRSKPKMGWHGGGWVIPFAFTQDVLEELTTEIPNIPIADVENVVAEYVQDRKSEKTKPKPAERKANLSKLERTVRALLKLLGRSGIDQISRHHIMSHVWFAGKPDLLKTYTLILKFYEELC